MQCGLRESVTRPSVNTVPTPFTAPSHSLGEASSGSRKEQDIGQFRNKKEAIAPGTNAQQDTMAV